MRRQSVLALSVLTCLVLFGGVRVAEAQCTVPYQFINGQVADATQVMANLNTILTCLNNTAPAGSTNALQYKSPSGGFGAVGPLSNGQIVIGSTGNAPQGATLSGGSGITITNGPGSVTITASGISFNPRGAWSGAVTYNPGDIVIYNGTSYLCYSAITAPTATTWNFSDKTSDITLSAGNLVASHTSGANYGGVRSTTKQTSGKYYFEVNVGNLGGNNTGIGIANPSASLSVPLGSDANHNGIGLWGIGSIKYGGATVANGFGLRGNNQIAIDVGAKLVWIRGNGDAWNYNGAADPALGTGGIDITDLLAAGDPFASSVSQSNGEFFTFDPGPTGFTGTVPVGFTAGWPGGAANPSPDQDPNHWLP